MTAAEQSELDQKMAWIRDQHLNMLRAMSWEQIDALWDCIQHLAKTFSETGDGTIALIYLMASAKLSEYRLQLWEEEHAR